MLLDRDDGRLTSLKLFKSAYYVWSSVSRIALDAGLLTVIKNDIVFTVIVN